MNLPMRVVKVGGSLLALTDLPTRLRGWLAAQPPAINVVIAGGGPLAAAVRQWDERFQLGEETSHWLCVDVLDVSTRLISGLLPTSSFSEDWQQCSSFSGDTARCVCLLPGHFL